MQTITLLAQKGGTGKTSLALALAVCAADAGQIAVILDVDPQATACNWHHRRRHADAPVVSHVQPTRLRHTCATAAAQGVDLAVIDTPARTEAAALEASRIADLVIIPLSPADLRCRDHPGNSAASRPRRAPLRGGDLECGTLARPASSRASANRHCALRLTGLSVHRRTSGRRRRCRRPRINRDGVSAQQPRR